uniref:BHLH domain-containing protein n=1 Tax=Oryza nivara TaxID=4536 RepID=A0A0E0GZT0_ORYNI
MEHHHLLLQLSPPPPPPPLPAAHLMMSPSFFDAGVFADVGGDWMEDLMHLGELFGVGVGGDDDDNGGVDGGVGGGDDRMQEWQNNCEGAGSPDHQPSCGDGDGDGDGDVSPRDGELGDGDGDNSATRKRRDRSKTIVSERKRRVRMKEKLYELRALVPNITKVRTQCLIARVGVAMAAPPCAIANTSLMIAWQMDKASIIADAVVYVKDLQAHARKLKEEVAALEEGRPIRPPPPSAAAQRPQRQPRRVAAAAAQLARAADAAAVTTAAAAPHGARVAHVGAAQVGEGRFFVTVECEPAAAAARGGGGGVAAPVCAAVESLSCFTVESSTVGCSPDRVVATLTLKVSEAEEDVSAISECTVKLWVMAALLKEGFRPQPTVQIS